MVFPGVRPHIENWLTCALAVPPHSALPDRPRLPEDSAAAPQPAPAAARGPAHRGRGCLWEEGLADGIPSGEACFQLPVSVERIDWPSTLLTGGVRGSVTVGTYSVDLIYKGLSAPQKEGGTAPSVAKASLPHSFGAQKWEMKRTPIMPSGGALLSLGLLSLGFRHSVPDIAHKLFSFSEPQ